MNLPGLIDIGVNLADRRFAADRPQVLERAQRAGIVAMLLTGTSEPSSREVLALAREEPGFLFATAGIHPHHAKDADAGALAAIRALAAAPEVVAVGETGLDFNRDFSPRPVQERVFEAQLELAAETGMPVFLHQRDAHARFLPILREFRGRLAGGVVHCFTGTRGELADYLDLDLHIGITGWIADERRGLALREAVRDIPRGRLLLETDAPWLLPRDLRPKPRGGRNEPAFLPHVLDWLARCRAEPAAELAAAALANSQALFRLGDLRDAG